MGFPSLENLRRRQTFSRSASKCPGARTECHETGVPLKVTT